MNKLYSVHDHWTDINKKNDVDIESIDGVITGIKVNGEDYGGGTSWTEVFSGDVVTTGEAAPFSGTINANLSGADTIKVFYNDGVYILPKQVTDYGIFYGAPAAENPGDIDFSEIPFIIDWGEVSRLYTQSPGPQNITILEPESGGGESDFTKVNVTLEVSVDGHYGNYNIYLIDSDRNATALTIGAVQTPFGELRIFNTQSLEEHVEYGSSITKEIYLYQNNYFVVTETNADAPSDFALTGNAEAVMGEISGDSACLVKVYGDCTISVAGGR